MSPGLTKVSEVKKILSSATMVQQQPSVAASDAESIDVSASVEVAETGFYALSKSQDLHLAASTHHPVTEHNQRKSLEMPVIVSSASSIKLNRDGAPAKPRVHGTTVSNRNAARHAVSRRKH